MTRPPGRARRRGAREFAVMNRHTALAPLALAAALVSCAPQPAPNTAPPGASSANAGPRQCFPPSAVSSFRPVGEEAVLLRVGASQIWRLDLLGSCPDIEWSRGRLLIQQHFGGGVICSGLAADVITSDGRFSQRCLVEKVEKLSEAEIAALAPGQRP